MNAVDTDPRSMVVDPSQPVYPLRSTVVYPVPGVCTALWTEEDWQRTARTVTEPEYINGPGGKWRAVGRNGAGRLLYSLDTTPTTPTLPAPE